MRNLSYENEFCMQFHFHANQSHFRKCGNRELTLKCKLKCYEKPMKDPLGVSPSKGNQGTTRGKEKFLLTSVGIEPTTSGLDLPLLCRLSYEVGQRESETIMYPHFHMYPYFHKNGFALRLALKQRHNGTQKWPILFGC